jgi:hypothetical protein
MVFRYHGNKYELAARRYGSSALKRAVLQDWQVPGGCVTVRRKLRDLLDGSAARLIGIKAP